MLQGRKPAAVLFRLDVIPHLLLLHHVFGEFHAVISLPGDGSFVTAVLLVSDEEKQNQKRRDINGRGGDASKRCSDISDDVRNIHVT